MRPFSATDLQHMLDDFTAAGVASGKAVTRPPQLPIRPVSALGRMLSAPTANDIAILEDALSYASSDVPRGMGTVIGSDGAPVPDYWFGVGLAVRREYGEAGKEAFRKWSQKSSRYDDAGFEHAWAQYKPDHPNPVTIGSVFMLAKAMGWPGNSVSAATPRRGGSRFQLLDRSAIMALPPLRWRVKGLLPETGIAAIYGPSRSGKSFLSFDLGCAVATGATWFGHRTIMGPVTYVMLEGEAALGSRARAWEQHNGRPLPAGFRAMNKPFQISDLQQVEELGAILPQGGVVIIDTLNRAAPGLDENSSQDMGNTGDEWSATARSSGSTCDPAAARLHHPLFERRARQLQL